MSTHKSRGSLDTLNSAANGTTGRTVGAEIAHHVGNGGGGGTSYAGSGMSAKQRASKRALKTFNYANSALANTPTLVLVPLNNTFAQKTVDLFEPVKIGRKISPKVSPEPTNGIFDSKVLSRNHAEIWFEDGKVWIKDVKSSNGTFVDGKRLSEEGKESDPVELVEGARLEFGIDINNEDGSAIYQKVSCKVSLLDPSGMQQSTSPSLGVSEPSKSAAGSHSSRGPIRPSLSEMMDRELKTADATHAQLQTLKTSLDSLVANVHGGSTATLSADAYSASADLSKQLEEARAEIQSWMDKHNALQQRGEQNELLQKREKDLMAQVERLTNENSEAVKGHEEEAAGWKKKLEELMAEVTQLTKKNEEQQKNVAVSSSSSTKLTAVQKELEDVRSKYESLTKEKQKLTTDMTSLRATVEKSESQLKQQKEQFDKLFREAELLRAENEQLRQEKERLLEEKEQSANTSPHNERESIATAASAVPSSVMSPPSGASTPKRDRAARRRAKKLGQQSMENLNELRQQSVADAKVDEKPLPPTPPGKKATSYQFLALVAFGIISVGGLAYFGYGHGGLFNPDGPLLRALR